MLDFMRKNKGSISIFLCIIMLPMITYCSMIIDSSRLQASRTQLQCAGDMTMNAAMAEYEKVLEDMYGLFAVSEDPEKLKPALENYFYETISGSINSGEEEDEYVKNFSKELSEMIFSSNVKEDDVSNFLYMKLEDFAYEPVPESRVSNPMVMKSQIIDYMKYKGPVSIASNLLNKLGALKDSANQADAAKKKIEYTQEVSKLDEPMKKAWESIDKYNKTEEKFRTKGFDKPEKIRDMLTQMSEKGKTLAGNIKLGNTFRSYYAKQVGRSPSGDAYNDIDSGFKSIFGTSEIGSRTNWKDRMDYIGGLLDDRLVKAGAGELSGFEKAYGDITVTYGSDGSVSSVNIERLETGSDPNRPTYGNLKKWSAELSSAAAVSSDSLLTAYYDAQVGCLKNIGSIAEYKAYIEYAEYLKKEYSDLYDAHEDEINALSDAEQTAYKKVRNTLDKLDAELKKSDTYTEYRSFLKKLGDETPYSTHSPSNINTEFKEYYGYVKDMEKLSGDIDKSLGDILSQLDKVESKGNEWNAQIGKVEDDGVRSQMQSDHKTSTNSIKRDDITSLRKVVKEINAQLKGLKGEIEGVGFLDEKMCTSNAFTYSGLKDSKYLKAADITGALPSGAEIVNGLPEFKTEPLASGLGTSSEKLSNNIKQLEGLDGKDKYGNERKEEAFYNTLYNSYGVTARGLSADENSKVDKINNAAEVDDEGKPTGVEKDADKYKDKDKDKDKEKKENAGDADEVKKAYDKIVELNVPAMDTEEYGKAEGSSVSKNKDSDYSKNAGSGGSSLSSASKFLRLIENIAEELRDDVYLEEYFTEMFTCQTDKKLDPGKLKLINGYSNIPAAAGHYKPINMDNDWYGKEMEYILWGSSDLDKNLRSNETVIFLIRFALNAIYAFTAADIQSFANSVATALVGWTVVLVPVVSVCITLAIALAESAYDLYELKEGKDVPIFKDAHTFVCSPTGALTKVATEIIKEAAEKATNYIEDEIDKLIDKGAEEAGKTIAEARDTVQDVCNKYADKLTDSIKTSVKDQFVTPIMNSITPIVNGLNSSFSNADELVDEKVDAAFDSISESINNMQDGPTKELTLLFLSRYGDDVKSSVKEQLKDYIDDIGIKGLKITDISMDEIQKKVNDFVDEKIEAVDGFAKDIKNKVKELTDEMYEEIMSHGNELVSNLKGYVHEQIGEISSQITGNITNAITSSVSNAVSEGIDRSASGGLTLNYKEYCKIFMFIKLLSDSGEKNALLRAAALIQANVRYAVKDPDTNPLGGNKDFVISESYSIIYVGAKARMTTIFPWGVTVDDDGTGSADASFDISNMGDNSIVINFSGINGF